VIAILLLEMLRAEEQPFGPDDFVVERHDRESRPWFFERADAQTTRKSSWNKVKISPHPEFN
jgi:hypothetical protein